MGISSKRRKVSAFRLWLGSAIYIATLILSLGFIFPDSHLPVWFELVLKSTAVLAFFVVILVPVLHILTRSRQERSKAFAVAASIMIAGYALLFGLLLYAKLKTCDTNLPSHDDRWHCNVSGKGVVVYLILIPIIAAVVGIILAGIISLVLQKRSKDRRLKDNER